MPVQKQKPPSTKASTLSKNKIKPSPDPHPKLWQLFMGYPPEELGGKRILETDIPGLPNAYVTEYELRKKHRSEICELMSYNSLFEETNQPLMALHVFVLAAKLGIYPPLPVIGYLASGVHNYLEAEGEKKLDDCLGLVDKPGVGDHFTQWKKFNRDMKLRQYMILLRKTFGVTIEKAAEMVSKLPNSLSQRTLEDRFKKDPFWKLNRKILEPAQWLELKTIEVQQKFLKEFPLNALPDRLKPLHPDHKT